MKTFVADIIPSIQRYSHNLDNLTLLTNQHWVVIDELGQSKTVYIFRNTNELLISTNGEVEKAKWEYVGQNSILIDRKDDRSYLFKHGFFDENILALKVDGREEYAMLINESKYSGELNTYSAVLNFLSQNYPINPIAIPTQIKKKKNHIVEVDYKRDGYTIKMGHFKEFAVRLTGERTFNIYQKKSDGKYFIYGNNDIILFQNQRTCLDYLESHI
jgi:hypothetical protein